VYDIDHVKSVCGIILWVRQQPVKQDSKLSTLTILLHCTKVSGLNASPEVRDKNYVKRVYEQASGATEDVCMRKVMLSLFS
jgi:hypothetical protein